MMGVVICSLKQNTWVLLTVKKKSVILALFLHCNVTARIKKDNLITVYSFMWFCGPFVVLPHNLHYGPRGSCVGYLTFIAPTKHLFGGLTFTLYISGFLSQPTSVAASPANNTFHTLPLFCFLSFLLSLFHSLSRLQLILCLFDSLHNAP